MIVPHDTTSSPVEWVIIIVVYVSSRMKGHGVAGKTTHMDISNFPSSYYNPCQKDRSNVVCVVYDTTSSKSSLWVNHGKICDFAYRLPLKPSMLNLLNRVVHFDDAAASTVILKVWRCSITIRLFHLVSSQLQ